MNDKQIRVALRNKVFRHYRFMPNALVLEEVGIRHGAARVDFLVVNGLLHGFELKSDRDNLSRLENQIQIFSSVFDRMTLVVGYRLVDKALKMVPEWWGVKLANLGKRGGIHFRDARTPKNNPDVEKEAVAKLLWQNQALQVLEELGADAGVRSKTRKEIYARLAECADLDLIREKVRHFLILQKGPQAAGQQKLDDD
jgi:hypothetical protein